MASTKSDTKVETQAVPAAEPVPVVEAKPAQPAAPMLQSSAGEALQKYSLCAHCQSRLHFAYLTDFSRNLTEETARCPECHKQSHRVMHRLQ